MIFVSVGLPGRFAELCDVLILRLAERYLGSVAIGEFRTLNELASAVIRTDAAHLVAALRQPVVRLQAEIVQAGRPFVVALDDVYTAATELALRPSYDTVGATREIASSCAALLMLSSVPGAVVLSKRDQQDTVGLAHSIARHFGFALGEREITAVAAMIETAAAAESSLQDDDRQVAAGALDPYARYFSVGGELDPIIWEPELFFTGGTEDGGRVSVRGPVDITGRARFVIFGPYINLPPGAWTVVVAIGFSAETAGMSFVIEITAGAQLAHARVQSTGEQVIETSLSVTIGSSADHPVEIRVMSERAAFDGRIALGHVRLIHRRGAQTEAKRRLIASLRRPPPHS